jgi:hypothetical protein
MKNPDTTQGQPQVGTTALFAFLRGKMSDQKAKAAQKRREQRDADITASMHEEFSYVIGCYTYFSWHFYSPTWCSRLHC